MCFINATVLEKGRCRLLVRDNENGQRIIVNSPIACRFGVGDNVCIEYNGAMTRSIPPQINAENITRLSPCRCRCS